MKARMLVGFMVVLLLMVVAVGSSQAQGPEPPKKNEPTSPDFVAAGVWNYATVEQPADTYTGTYTSIAFFGGTPYVSYYDATNKDLRLANPVSTGGNCGPSNTWYCQTVDSGGDVGQYDSISIKSGTPNPVIGISYYDATNKNLKFAESTCPASPCTWNLQTIATGVGADNGKYTSFKYDALGTAHIAYQTANIGSGLWYAHSVASGGNCGVGTGVAGTWQCDPILLGLGYGFYNSLDVNGSNQPRIAYYNGLNRILAYASMGGASPDCGPGLNTWTCDPIDSSSTDVGSFASLNISKGSSDNPQIAYYDRTNGNIRLAYIPSSGGNCGPGNTWYCFDITGVGANITQPLGLALAVDSSGSPMIAYENASDDLAPTTLNLARVVGGFGNCGPFIQFHGNTWRCSPIDTAGNTYLNEANYVAMGLNPAGLITIAYSETDDYYTLERLKVAYQLLQLNLPLIMK